MIGTLGFILTRLSTHHPTPTLMCLYSIYPGCVSNVEFGLELQPLDNAEWQFHLMQSLDQTRRRHYKCVFYCRVKTEF